LEGSYDTISPYPLSKDWHNSGYVERQYNFVSKIPK